MARTDTLGHFLADVANAIRNLKGTTTAINPSNYDTLINNSVPSLGYVPVSWDSSGYATDIRWLGNEVPQYIFRANASTNYGTNNIAHITLPNTLTIIGQYAFSYCTALTIDNLPESLETVKTYAFNQCLALNITHIPASVKTIERYGFGQCRSLTEIHFDGTPTSISADAFIGCSNVTDVYVPWASSAVANAPWGFSNATIHYNSTGEA